MKKVEMTEITALGITEKSFFLNTIGKIFLKRNLVKVS
jgi:hypothetical protein